MQPWFYIKVRVGRFLANMAAAFVRDRERRHRLRYRLDPLNPERCIAYLSQHYTGVPPLDMAPHSQLSQPVWVCWLQGLQQAPQLVVNCVRSIGRSLSGGQQMILLTADNFSRYVSLPEVVVRKWHEGRISNTHFSDILRIHALARHGGCWMDATCLLTAPVPPAILGQPFFIYRTHGEFAYTFIQSCFMVSRPNHYILRKWCAAIDAYWQHENFLIHYFNLHLLFIALLNSDAAFADAFRQVPEATDEAMHTLFYGMMAGRPYSDDFLQQAATASFIHKLTYKYPEALLADESSIAARLSKPFPLP